MPAISILVPVYNMEKYLEDCMDSLINQTFEDIEIICIDDGSKDDSLAILRRYEAQDKRVRVYPQENSGLGKTRNAGFEKAQGEYIWFIDSDDWLALDACEKLYQYAQEHNPDIIYFGTQIVLEEENIPRSSRWDWTLKNLPKYLKNNVINAFDEPKYFINVSMEVWNRLYRREFITQNKIGFNAGIKAFLEDVLFNNECLINNPRILSVKDLFYFYRIRNTSVVGNLFNPKTGYYKNAIFLSKQTDEILARHNIDHDIRRIFLKRNLERIFSMMSHSEKVKRDMYPLLHDYFKGLDKEVCTDDFLKQLKLDKKLPPIASTPYKRYLIQSTIYRRTNRRYIKATNILEIPVYRKNLDERGGKKIRILGLRVYNKKVSKGLIKRKFLGFVFKTEETRLRKKYYLFGIKILSKRKGLLEVFQPKLDSMARQIDRINRKVDNTFYNIQVMAQIPFVHNYFPAFKRIHEGQDMVLTACGPTLNYYETIKDAVHCGVNNSIKVIDYLDYLFILDNFLVVPDANIGFDEYKGNNCKKFYGLLPPRRIAQLRNNWKRRRQEAITGRIPQHNMYRSNAYPFLVEDILENKWAINLEQEAFGDFLATVFLALQFMLYTHPQRIFLVGCDASSGYAYQSDVTLTYRHHLKRWRAFKAFVEDIYPDVEIISVNPVNLKGMFKDVYTEKYAMETFTEEELLNIDILDANENIIRSFAPNE